MKTFTIRGISPELDTRLKAAAKGQSMSVNQWILKLLRESVGLEKEIRYTREYHDLDELFGSWSEEEYEEFEQSQAEFQKIDGEMWK